MLNGFNKRIFGGLEGILVNVMLDMKCEDLNLIFKILGKVGYSIILFSILVFLGRYSIEGL